MPLKKYLILLCCFLLPISVLYSQHFQTVKGLILDKDSKKPLSDVSVIIETSSPQLGSSSDSKGFFKIQQVPVGLHQVKISKVGYEPAHLSEVFVNSGKEVYLNIELSESVSQLPETVISQINTKGKLDNEMATVSARSFSLEEAGRFAGNLNNDVSRIAQSYAGVNMSDQSNELVIRGNSSKGMLWRLEGVEVPNLNHLANDGSSGGGLSLLSVNVFRNSEFYTGAFPAEYGNAISGVFDVKLRNGNSDKYEFAFQGGFLGLEAAAEGPLKIKNGSSFLTNYRYSTMGLFNAIGFDIVGVAVPKFHDLTLKILIPISAKTVFQAFCVSGMSSVTIPSDLDSMKWDSPSDRYQPTVRSNMIASGLVLKHQINDKSNLNFLLSFSGNSLINQNDSLNQNYSLINVSKQIFNQSAFRISTNLNYKISAKSMFRSGLIYSLISYHLNSENVVNRLVYINQNGNANTLQFYFDLKHRFNQLISMNFGFHSFAMDINKSLSFEPRFSFLWQFSKKQSLGIGLGVHSKAEPLTFYYADVLMPDGKTQQCNRNLKPSKAIHAVLSYENSISKNFRFKTECYYQFLFDVPVENNRNSGFSVLNYGSMYSSDIDNVFNIPLVNKGKGENYGIEFTFEKFFSNQYYFLSTISLFESKYLALDNVKRNTRFNTNFISNWIVGKEFLLNNQPNKAIIADLKIVYCGGDRLTPVNLDSSKVCGYTVYDLSKRYSINAPDYFRLDVKIGYRLNKQKSTHYIYMDVQNLTNKQNLYYRFYDSGKMEVVNYYHLGIIPILNYRLNF